MQRNISFDVIRVCAILMIVVYHYNVIFSVGFSNHFGSIGNIIFFTLSGFLITMSYKRHPGIKTFYKKRYMSIFPLLIVTFIIFYFLHSLRIRNFFYGGNFSKIILSLLGFDGYLLFYGVSGYYITGEWFTMAILYTYLIFPLLYKLMRKNVWLTTIVLFGLYMWDSFRTDPFVPQDARIFIVTFVFWTGMVLEYISEKHRYSLWLVIPLIAVIIYIRLNLSFISINPIFRYIYAVSIFLVMYILFSRVHFNEKITHGLVYLSNICYAIYLVHHYIIYYMVNLYSEIYDTPLQRVVLFVLILIIVVLAASIVYKITNDIVGFLTGLFKKRKKIENNA